MNKFLYSGAADRVGKSWVIEFGDCTRTFKGHKHSVSCLTYKDGLGNISLIIVLLTHEINYFLFIF